MNLRAAARGQPCQVRIADCCNGDPETTVLAHFRLIGISGIGLKVPDLLGAHACSGCHSYIDTHKDDATQLAFALGVLRTIAKLVREGKVRT